MHLPTDVFVFGSNSRGHHGCGSAKFAHQFLGAMFGVAEGKTGGAYALPTRDYVGGDFITRPIKDIEESIHKLIDFSLSHPHLNFKVARIGCTNAGLSDEEVSSIFKKIDYPSNIILPRLWEEDDGKIRFVVAGSRHLDDPFMLYPLLDSMVEKYGKNNLEFVCGKADGIDTLGEDYAKFNGIKYHEFPAEWTRFGKAAGSIRNQEMSWFSDKLLAVYDGVSDGTTNMITTATRDKLEVFSVII